MAPSVIYKCREIDFRGAKRMILYPNHGQSRTALLALANCLLLNGNMTITPEANNVYPLQSLIMRMRRMYRMKHRSLGGDAVITKADMDNSVAFLSDLFDVDIDFTSNDSIQSSKGKLDMFEHFNVRLLHACMIQSNDTVISGAVGTGYQPVFKVEHSLPRKSDPLVQKFLDSGVTSFGINELQNIIEEDGIFALFRKGSFHSLTKHNGTLFVLNNVIGASDKDVWKEFSEQDDGKIYNSNFVSEPMSENRSEDIQQAQADVVSQTLSSVSEGMLKCLKPTCQAEFLSRVNLNRHKQVHTKDLQASFGKVELRKHWDELSLEEAAKVLSIKGMHIQGISGDILCQVIENVDNGSEFYDRANRMKALLDGTKKISSDELFMVLDEDSENTAFSTDIRSCPEKIVFSFQLLLLSDLKNVLACFCYFIEKNMVSSWLVWKTAEATRHAKALLQESNNSLLCGISQCSMRFTSEINFNRHKLAHMQTDTEDFMENIDAISQYWDDLTDDQARQILSLKGKKIKGFNLKNLQSRLKKFDQDNPHATTGKQLIDILGSYGKMESRQMLAVLEKASENTHFCNDIQSCNDDEVLAVGDNRCTPSNDLALMSYIIERKLVQGWFLYKESVTSGTQGQPVHDPKSEQRCSDTVEPDSVGGDKLLDKRDSMESKAADGVSTSEHILNPTSGDTVEPDSVGGDKLLDKRDSMERKAADGVPTGEHISNPTSGILLEEFVRSNKLTKIYKIRPKDVFKVLKRSLKTLKKDFESKYPKKKLKAVFKLSTVILTHWGRKCARGYLLWIVKKHREGNSWNGCFQLSDMQVFNGQFIISKAADPRLTLESASADFKRLWDLLLVPFYKNAMLGSYPLYFDQFGSDMLNLPDPVTDPDGFMKHEKYLALHFAFMPPLSRLTLLISLYKAYDSNRVVPDHAYQPLNKSMSYDWRDDIKTLPILTSVYYFSVHGHLSQYTSSYFHLLKFSRHFGSHDLDHTKLPGVAQMVPDMIVTDLVIGQLLAPSLAELILFIVKHTNMEGRFFRPFHQFESSDDDVFFCVEDDDDDDSADSEGSDAADVSA